MVKSLTNIYQVFVHHAVLSQVYTIRMISVHLPALVYISGNRSQGWMTQNTDNEFLSLKANEVKQIMMFHFLFKTNTKFGLYILQCH